MSLFVPRRSLVSSLCHLLILSSTCISRPLSFLPRQLSTRLRLPPLPRPHRILRRDRDWHESQLLRRETHEGEEGEEEKKGGSDWSQSSCLPDTSSTRSANHQHGSAVRRTVVPFELLRQPQDGMPTRVSSVGTEEGLVRQQREREELTCCDRRGYRARSRRRFGLLIM